MTVVVRLSGGLGNQIFQLGVAHFISDKCCSSIRLDVSGLSSYSTPRSLSLHHLWDLSAVCKTDRPIASAYLNRVRAARLLSVQHKNISLVNDRNILEALVKFKNSKFYYLDGYFIESIAQNHFESWVDSLGRKLKGLNAGSGRPGVIHIRGGDFLSLGWEMSDAREFYHKAVLDACAENSVMSFAVVTDDRTYACEILRGLSIDWDFVGGSEIEDFMTLLKGETAIIGNSTFSYCARAFSELRSHGSLTYAMSHWRPGVPRKLRLRNERYGVS